MYIIGISAFYHDSAACIIKNNNILAAAQEERFTRKKHDNDFPLNSLKYCIKYANIKPNQISHIVFYEKPFLKFERLLETYLSFAPKGFKSFSRFLPSWVKDKLFVKNNIIDVLKTEISKDIDWSKKILFSEHHLSHAASAFYPSPFEKAAILTIDAVGEWATTSIAIGNKNKIKILKEINFPHSLGMLYSAFTYYVGFKVNSGEYKMMGLAPYGEPNYVDKIKDNLINIYEDGSFKLNLDYFDFCTGLTMTNDKFSNLFGIPPRNAESKIEQIHMDLSASIQKVTEEIIIKIAKNISSETKEKNLCLAGGVALNCVANGVLKKSKIFENIWIQPAAGDAGGSIGAALSVFYQKYQNKRVEINKDDSMQGSYLGPSFNKEEIIKSLNSKNITYKENSETELIETVAKLLSEDNAIGWMQGRMEFGPRALGNRSIIANPKSSKMQKQLNLKVKFRESFRPFAPSILSERSSEWFDYPIDSPYMLLVTNINDKKCKQMSDEEIKLFGIDKLNVQRSEVPAVTHVDYSARVQTVSEERNKKYYKLIKKFEEITECPILVNTSFNIRGEPIVCTPDDAIRCFLGTNLDALVIENFIILKKDQKSTHSNDYRDNYELD